MIGHITYLSEQMMREKFGRQLRDADKYSYDFNSEFAVETYLDHQGQSFVERFDANSYLYITRASDYFDLTKDYGSLSRAFENAEAKTLVISFSSDWLFTPQQSQDIVNALIANGKDVSYCNIDSPYGHDAFLLEPDVLGSLIRGFLRAAHQPHRRWNNEKKAFRKNHFSRFEQARRTRLDYALIESLIEPDSAVLDIGCGDGELLEELTIDKNIKAKGIELDQHLVLECVNRGLTVIQHDVEKGLKNHADKKFDYVILSQTVQTLKNPEKVLMELLRVGKKVIVSFPNFAYWRCRLQLFFRGKAPVTKKLPFEWYNSPNIHFLSMRDFNLFCRKLGAKVEKRIPLAENRKSPVGIASNLLAEQIIYLISKD